MTRTFLLIAGLTALFMACGFMLGGQTGVLLAFVAAAAMNLFAYWNSDKMVLSMYGARQVDAKSAPDFYQLVADLAARADLPMPKVYIIESRQPNAFATGRNPEHAAVAATTGLLQILTAEEIAGVMAHELAHVKNRDTLTMTITATLAGAISMLANFAFLFGGNRDGERAHPLALLALAILAPFAAMIVQMAISRTREYSADRLGAEISGSPLGLANALAKLEQGARAIDNPIAERHPATAHLFIVNPLHAHQHDSLFSTHPSTTNRIKRLKELFSVGTMPKTYAGNSAPARRKRSAGGSVPDAGDPMSR